MLLFSTRDTDSSAVDVSAPANDVSPYDPEGEQEAMSAQFSLVLVGVDLQYLYS